MARNLSSKWRITDTKLIRVQNQMECRNLERVAEN